MNSWVVRKCEADPRGAVRQEADEGRSDKSSEDRREMECMRISSLRRLDRQSFDKGMRDESKSVWTTQGRMNN